MIDGNQLREEFGRYLAEHKATRWGMDAALMHVCKIAYDAGKGDVSTPAGDYMKEAERLVMDFGNACYKAGVEKESWEETLLKAADDVRIAHTALLAHIQRGAAPDGVGAFRHKESGELRYVLIGGQHDEDEWDDVLIVPMLAAAPAPDPFCDAAVEKAWGRFEAELQRGQVKGAAPAEAPDKWEYYYRDNDCPAADSGDPNCICWHDEGRGPYNNARHDDEDTFLEWRRVKAPAPAEPERRIGPASDADMVVYQSIADGYSTRAPAPADDRIAAAIHYPECWDTAAYPTVESALAEVFAHYHCTEHDAPAEVPMPGADFVLSYDGWHRRYLLKEMPVGSVQVWNEQAVRTYGAACRAAGEAAGYARGLKEAGRLVSLWIKDPDVQRMLEFARDASRKVTSWPDRLNGEAEAALRGEVK